MDLFAMYKLNMLHLHLTDDQGWRFEVRRYPLLTEVGGFRQGPAVGNLRDGRVDDEPHGGFYRQAELADLVAYAAAAVSGSCRRSTRRGTCRRPSPPTRGLGNAPDRRLPVRREWGVSPHVLNVSDQALAFLRGVLDELVEIFPFEYVHIGSDEVPALQWTQSGAALRRVAAEGLPGPEPAHLVDPSVDQAPGGPRTAVRRLG